jgi:polysaccharide export outer membrane protein
LPDLSASSYQPDVRSSSALRRDSAATSLRELAAILYKRRYLFASCEGGLLLLCLAYCLITPKQYEASARVALRTSPASSLNIEAAGPLASASILSAPLQQETLANFFRSDQLAWGVIADLKLYEAAGFKGRFSSLYPQFHLSTNADRSGPAVQAIDAQSYLLERFQKRLLVETLPRSLVIQIRFRSRDAALSAAIVNDLIRMYGEQDRESHVKATEQESRWLGVQLGELKIKVDRDQQRLSDFQSEHELLSTPDTLPNGESGESQHNSIMLEIDQLGRELAAATADRILRESEYRAATEGDPELVIASDSHLQAEYGTFATAQLQQIHTRHGDLQTELAQLSTEHGPNFPRALEIRNQIKDLDAQKKVEDAKMVKRFSSAWQTAIDREVMVKKSLDERTAEGMRLNEAATQYAVMRQEANSSHDLYMRLQSKMQEAGLAAGVASSNISVVDYARQPVDATTPNPPLYMAITFFVGLWLSVGAALLIEALHPAPRAVVALLVLGIAGTLAQAQAPTPNLDGLPSGVARLPFSTDSRATPDAKAAPASWSTAAPATTAAELSPPTMQPAAPMPAPIAPGDSLDISEFHLPEFHSLVRVSADGTVRLPMINDVKIVNMDEQSAARVIESALLDKGLLLHPQVSVMITIYVGQDISVLGEVTRPGIYPFTLHHRLLDVISSASGLGSNAGRLVNVFHRDDPRTPHSFVLDLNGSDSGTSDNGVEHNPELNAGDTVQVSRAGVVYVVGDVVRPGAFPVDPTQGLTVVQALSLAWGPSQNAGATRALLIREQKGGRTLTTLNLRRMIHGQDPDQPITDRDILFVPDSMAKNMWNRTMEAAVQSAIGVTLYAGMVYSQRF